MKTYSSVIITLIVLIVLLLIIELIFKPEDLLIPIVGCFIIVFMMDLVFLIREKKEIENSRKHLFPFIDFTWRKQVYYFLLIVSIAGFLYMYFKYGQLTFSSIMVGVIGLFGFRGIIFGSQTMEAIRIDNEYIEYGFGLFDNIKIVSIRSYSIDYENKVLILKNEKKDIRIKIKYVEDIKKLDEVLKEKIKL